MAEATELDAERRELTLDRGERLGYDSLIVACGAETSYFGHDEWQEPSFALKTLDGRRRAARADPLVASRRPSARPTTPAERERL